MIGPDPRPLRDAGLSTAALPYARKAPPPEHWERWCTTRPTDAEFDAMFDDGARHNIAVLAGPASGGLDALGEPYSAGLIVMVFNNRRFFDAWDARHDLLRWTWVAESHRGPHVYLRLNDELPPRTLYWNAGPSFPSVLELRTTGAYVVGPDSLHPKGTRYTWCKPRPDEIRTLDLDEFRDWFRERRHHASEDGWRLALGPGGATRANVQGPRQGFAEKIGTNVPRILPDEVRGPVDAGGERHYTLVSLAGTLRRRGLASDEIAACLLEVNARRCKPPCPEPDVVQIAKSVARYDPNEVPNEADTSFDVETRPRIAVQGEATG